jgi:membrane protein implicated in regulation of membrane protease activity
MTLCIRSVAVHAWIIWLIIAAVLGAVEIFTVTLAFGLVAIGALVAAVAGAAGGDLAVQFGAFVVASAVGLGVARPIAMRHVRQPPVLRTGAAALVGRTAVVVEEVTGDGGRVRIGADLWSSRSYDETLVIAAGTRVDVLQIEGATALVYPRE